MRETVAKTILAIFLCVMGGTVLTMFILVTLPLAWWAPLCGIGVVLFVLALIWAVQVGWNDMSQQWVLEDIVSERRSQDAKWGSQRHLHNDVWNRILGEEVGEVAKALNEQDPLECLRQELIQVAAVAVAWVEALDSLPSLEEL